MARDQAGNEQALKLALEHEAKYGAEPGYLGWRWSDVRTHPATLTKLVVDGVITVTFRSNSQTRYRLTDPDSIKGRMSG